jgi:hypothetical protein
MAIGRIIGISTIDQGKVDEFYISQKALSNPSACLKAISNKFIIQDFHDVVIFKVSLPVGVFLHIGVFIEREQIHLFKLELVILLTSMRVYLASDTDSLLFLPSLRLFFLNFPDLIHIPNSGHLLVLIFNKWIVMFKVDWLNIISETMM